MRYSILRTIETTGQVLKTVQPLPEGSYYYRIDLDGNSTVDFEGWLYLTR